ncbi:60S ribosomal protein L8B [Haplosporangium gracile]|nr:60S ribosomal protein L8B [Haplosporangium gracile]
MSAQSSSSAVGSSSAAAASSKATTTIPAATTTPAPASATPGPAANNRMARRAAWSARAGFPIQPSAMDLDRTVRVLMNSNTNRALRPRQLLNNRRGIPPKLSHYIEFLNENVTHMLFRFANKCRPETRTDNKLRRRAKKAAKAAETKKNKGRAKAVDSMTATAAYDEAANKAFCFLKYGMNHIVALAEKQLGQLIAISDDIEPLEVLIWLPALCRTNIVPYAVVKGSARLGTLVNKRSTTAVAFREIRKEEQLEFSQLVDAINAYYASVNQQPARSARMGTLLGFKARVKVVLRTTVAANRLQQHQESEI